MYYSLDLAIYSVPIGLRSISALRSTYSGPVQIDCVIPVGQRYSEGLPEDTSIQLQPIRIPLNFTYTYYKKPGKGILNTDDTAPGNVTEKGDVGREGFNLWEERGGVEQM